MYWDLLHVRTCYIIKKNLRVSGTRGMRQGGRLKMCSPHRLIMKERNFFWVLGKGVTLNWKNICIDNILYTVLFFFQEKFYCKLKPL